MKTMFAVALSLYAAGACAAQSSAGTAPNGDAAPKHYRLTFILTYPQSQQPSQSFVLDVPVAVGRPGVSILSAAEGPDGQIAGSVQKLIRCTDVHASANGLAAKVDFVIGSASAPLPGSTEPVHHQMTFEKQIDVPLATPTRITNEMHMVSLRKGDPVPAATQPPAPQITVTAVEL